MIPMTQVDDLSRSFVAFDQTTSLTVVVEMSQSSWLVAGMVPGVDRQPLKKLEPDPDALLRLLERWRAEAVKTGRAIERIVLAYEAGRDGFWLARWLRARDVDVHVIHSTSVAVSREHRRAKTDRLDTAMLMRVFLGWLRGERGHCAMVAIPTADEEDAKRPSRERSRMRPANLDHGGHGDAPFQVTADDVVLGRTLDGDPFQRHVGAAVGGPAWGHLQDGMAADTKASAINGRSEPGSSRRCR